jgi:excisionase family DNA binding protein
MAKHIRPTRAMDDLPGRGRRTAVRRQKKESALQSRSLNQPPTLPISVGLERLFTIDQIAQMGGPKRAKLYLDIRAGRLKAIKFGRSTRISEGAYRAYLEAAPTV